MPAIDLYRPLILLCLCATLLGGCATAPPGPSPSEPPPGEAPPAENAEILILLTDTPDHAAEKALQKKLKSLKSLQSLGMTFGHTDA